MSARMDEFLEKLLKAFSGYYSINTEDPYPPFDAEAEFRMHNEQYLLIRSAKITEYDSAEFVYFAKAEELDPAAYAQLDELAWNHGMSRVVVGENHRNSDVTLIILTEKLDPSLVRSIRKNRRYKSYRMTLKGWSDYRLAVYEVSTGRLVTNSKGDSLKQTFEGITKAPCGSF